jgi:light-harvesting complex I chlorophyll a/b binding protein 1
VEEVAQDMETAEAPGRRLEASYVAPNLRAPAPRAGTPAMKGSTKGLLYGAVKTADGDLYGNFFEDQVVRGAIKSGRVGTTFPLGVWDPLNLIGDDAAKYRRWEEMEIKHGRIAMAAFVHVIVTEAGIRWPGYLSDGTFGGEPIKFADMPPGTLASWAAMPPLGWAQIIAFVALLDSRALQEGLPDSLADFKLGQDPSRDAGDVAGPKFQRYADKQLRDFKLNVERNNGRAAMFGIIGMMIHESLTGNPLFPFNSV